VDSEFPCVWWWRSKLPERKGQACRVLVRGRMNSILVEFEDGARVVTSRYAVRERRVESGADAKGRGRGTDGGSR
jgi:hypothetical protein